VPAVKQKGLVMTSLSTVDEKQPMVSRLSTENKVFLFLYTHNCCNICL